MFSVLLWNNFIRKIGPSNFQLSKIKTKISSYLVGVLKVDHDVIVVVHIILDDVALDGEVLVHHADLEDAVSLYHLGGDTLLRFEHDVVLAVFGWVDGVVVEWPHNLAPEWGLVVPGNIKLYFVLLIFVNMFRYRKVKKRNCDNTL